MLDNCISIPDRVSDEFFSPHCHMQTSSEPHPASYPVGTAEGDHSPPSGAEVKTVSTLPFTYMFTLSSLLIKGLIV
jgi:hypothetical protein